MSESLESVFGDTTPDPTSDIAVAVMSLKWAQGGNADEHGDRYGRIQEIADPIIKTALAEARAEGRRQGLEEAAKVTAKRAAKYGAVVGTDREQRGDAEAAIALTIAADTIRSLATAPAETGESHHGES